MNWGKTYMLVFALMLIYVNERVILYNSFPLQLRQFPFLHSSLVLLKINRFGNSFFSSISLLIREGRNLDNPNQFI